MKKLPNKLKQIIKRKRFSLDTLQSERDWRGGMKIDYRITMVKSCEEDYYDHLTPLNTEYGRINVNLGARLIYQECEWIKTVLMHHLNEIMKGNLSEEDKNIANSLISLAEQERIDLRNINKTIR